MAWSSGIRIPVSSPVISGAALRCWEKGKGKGATDVWACGSVTERAGRGARTRAPCCCMGRLRRLGHAQRGVLGCPSGPSEGVGGRGPGRETGPRSEEGRRGGGGLGWVGLLLGFGFSISFPPFYFLFQPN